MGCITGLRGLQATPARLKVKNRASMRRLFQTVDAYILYVH